MARTLRADNVLCCNKGGTSRSARRWKFRPETSSLVTALEKVELPKVGVHVLRHSAAARIVQAGGSPKTLQTVLGHRSAAFSLTVYAHLFDADLDALADRLEASEEKAE